MSPCSLVTEPEEYSQLQHLTITTSCFTGLSFSHVSCSKLCSYKRHIRNQKVLRSSQRKAKQHWKKNGHMWWMSVKKNKTITEDVLGKFGIVTDIWGKQLLYVVRFHILPVQYEAQDEQDIVRGSRQWTSIVPQFCSSPEAYTMSHPNLMLCSKNLTLRHVSCTDLSSTRRRC